MKAQYAILRFAKYKGPEIGHIESHNERTKEKYASNPDVDTSRSHLNFHLVTPQRKYRAEAEKQIAEAGCRTRSDSVRVVEALVTASPAFFKGKKKGEVRAYFQEALDFIKQNQSSETIISAVVHMDEKTPHMHLCFVPLTEDGRLSAKEILGNKKKLTQWQDRFWEHMVKKYPDLERGESASETGRDHIPPRLFKEAVHLNRMKEQIMAILNDTNPFNKKAKLDELEALLGKYVPGAEALRTKLKKYDAAYKALTAENAVLEKQLGASSKESVLKKLEINEKLRELDELHRMVDGIRRRFCMRRSRWPRISRRKDEETKDVKGGWFYLEMNVRDDQKLVEIWLTNAEKIDPVLREGLKEIYAKYKTKKYMVAVFESGKGDLYENTRDLLLFNRRRSAEKAVQQAKKQRAAGMER